MHGVKRNRRRIGPLLRNHRDVIACPPFHQLLTRCRTEGIARSEQHLGTLSLQRVRQFADRRGLAGAVHARDHDDQRLDKPHFERFFEHLEVLRQDLAQRLPDGFGVLDTIAAHARTQRHEKFLRCFDPRIGHNERGLEFVKERCIDLDADKEAANALTSAGKPLPKARDP